MELYQVRSPRQRPQNPNLSPDIFYCYRRCHLERKMKKIQLWKKELILTYPGTYMLKK
jgi:hypothetical protein